ncbi:MAG: InlB B-repeat-containing protein [Clostridiales bacterium]|nr:InlB B-repeat-containing protein [Clostridiales bacterium]
MKILRTLCAILLVLFLFAGLPVTALGGTSTFTYTLKLSDQNGRDVYNPRELSSGDKINIEIELKRTDVTDNSYDAYGMEFRLSTLGLEYNNDGSSYRSGTSITKQEFDSGDSVGFAYYDMEQIGESVNNPSIVGTWSYTVTDPSAINISVPVALVYVSGDTGASQPVGNARLFLDPNGGSIVGTDVSGDYTSGSVVTLPDASFGEYIFEGWSDGVDLYQPGDEYTVSGIVTLTAQWKDLERNRQVLFDPGSGKIEGNDPSGMYADGEVITIPDAARNNYYLSGWSMGGKDYAPGDTYTVDNSVVFIAQWEEGVQPTEPVAPTESAPVETVTEKSGSYWWIILLIFIPVIFILFFILWKRFIQYSLIDGSVKLSFRDKRRVESVDVYLYRDGKEIFLGKSGSIDPGVVLKLISGSSPVPGLKKSFFKGRLHITYTDGSAAKDISAIIRTVEKRFE